MLYVALYVVTALVFLAMDVVMLKKVMYPLFSSNIGGIMHEDPKMGAAAVFYLFLCWRRALVCFNPCAELWPNLSGLRNGLYSRYLGLWNLRIYQFCDTQRLVHSNGHGGCRLGWRAHWNVSACRRDCDQISVQDHLGLAFFSEPLGISELEA